MSFKDKIEKLFEDWQDDDVKDPMPLRQYYKTLHSKDDLMGLRVINQNGEYVYIKSVEDGIWAGKNKDDEFGHHYSIDDLSIDK